VNTSQLVADTYINMTETMIREQVRRCEYQTASL